jgi:hypothetical protein
VTYRDWTVGEPAAQGCADAGSDVADSDWERRAALCKECPRGREIPPFPLINCLMGAFALGSFT